MITEGSREGNEEKKMNTNTDDTGAKRKRPRVGEVKVPSRNLGAPRENTGEYRDYNSYGGSDSRGNRNNSNYNSRSSNENRGGYSGGNRGGYSNDRPSYSNNDRNNNYSNNDRGGNYSNDRGGNYSGDRGGYSNNRNNYSNNDGGNRRPSYNSGNQNNNRGGGYSRNNNNNNRGGGYGGGNRNNNGNRTYGNREGQSQLPKNDRVISKVKHLIKPVKYKENIDPNTDIRLNKYLANAGVCSRREADTYITAGVVKVNGVVISELGAKVKRGDTVTFHDEPVKLESKVYVLLNKPKNCVTTSDDPQNRMTVMDLVKNACPERIYPVGRLDRNTTGVLLLTNDGDLASKLMHPKFLKKKIYQVKLDRDVAIEDMQAIADGITLDDGEIHADSIAYVAEDVLDEVGIEIHSGRNRVVRRIFEKLGYQVIKLDRVYFAGLTKKNLTKGRWRYLTESEVNMLRMGAFE
ncbi:MAG: pseudouridine synthase [Dysgonomonas sp.]